MHRGGSTKLKYHLMRQKKLLSLCLSKQRYSQTDGMTNERGKVYPLLFEYLFTNGFCAKSNSYTFEVKNIIRNEQV
ncbi:hypothetical protein BCU23_17665 [Vibrio splendidus]|nr:hypothetical protein BCU44_19280 [Vibrio cyclitrophicus]PMI98662.1 hypothetical protein BCU63_12085 [Vibrio splendidus]PMJ69534.1 hypothetical protein BCU23_17665 [Vibrio splendidus]